MSKLEEREKRAAEARQRKRKSFVQSIVANSEQPEKKLKQKSYLNKNHII